MTTPSDETDETDYRCRVSESSERNKGPILEVLERVLPDNGLVLEIGAGTGQHAAHFAPRFPGLEWQPTDPDPAMRDSIAAWVEDTGAPNLRSPVILDVTEAEWPITEAAAVFSANMIHIAPWDCCLGLLAGAGRILGPGGVLVLYGPFKRHGRHTAPSNESFDQSLRARDPAWGVRDLDAVADAAGSQGLALAETVEMPANNLIAVFRRRGHHRSATPPHPGRAGLASPKRSSGFAKARGPVEGEAPVIMASSRHYGKSHRVVGFCRLM